MIQYLTAWARVTLPHKKAVNPEGEKRLWEWCEAQVNDIGNNEKGAAAAAPVDTAAPSDATAAATPADAKAAA